MFQISLGMAMQLGKKPEIRSVAAKATGNLKHVCSIEVSFSLNLLASLRILQYCFVNYALTVAPAVLELRAPGSYRTNLLFVQKSHAYIIYGVRVEVTIL